MKNLWLSPFLILLTHLGTKTESITIGESSTGIVKNARTVHFSLEIGGSFFILGNNAIRMSTAIFVNMIYCILDV